MTRYRNLHYNNYKGQVFNPPFREEDISVPNIKLAIPMTSFTKSSTVYLPIAFEWATPTLEWARMECLVTNLWTTLRFLDVSKITR